MQLPKRGWPDKERRCRRGHILIMVAIIFPSLIAIMGLALDGGYIYHIKRRMQTAADAGAMGGAQELWRGNSSGAADAARFDATLNDFTSTNATVTVNIPPTSGARNGDSNFVEVIIEREVPVYFMRIVNRQSATVKARAVAGLLKGAGGCVMAMNPTERGALTVSGTSTLTATCGVMVNSNDSQAIRVPGGGCIYANEIGVTGGWNDNGTQCTYPTPTTQIPRAIDPLSYLSEPAIPSSTQANNLKITVGTVSLSPGTYTNGIEISGGTVTFQPGTYVIDGGGFKITGNAVLMGSGVTFFITKTGGGQWGDFDIAGTVRTELSAPTTGTYEGMLFWVDNDSPSRNPGNKINGTSDSILDGALYFPSTHVEYAGTTSVSNWTMIIADTITVTGNAVVENEFGASDILPPTRLATLVE